jgi:hypothetical protein
MSTVKGFMAVEADGRFSDVTDAAATSRAGGARTRPSSKLASVSGPLPPERNAIDDYFFDAVRDKKGIDIPVERRDELELQIMDVARARFPG